MMIMEVLNCAVLGLLNIFCCTSNELYRFVDVFDLTRYLRSESCHV